MRWADHPTRTRAALDDDPQAIALALEAGGVGVFEIDGLTREPRFSRRACVLWGFEDEAPTPPERLLAAMHPDDRHLAAQITRALEPGGTGTFTVEHRVVHPDGRVRWLQIRGRTQFEGAGSARRAVRCLGTMVDVTERREAERRAQDYELQLRLAMEAADTFGWETDVEHGTMRWSPNAARVIGCDPALLTESIEQSTAFAAPEERERLHAEFAAVARRGDTEFRYEFRGLDGPAGRRHWQGRARVFYRADGAPLRVIGATQDVTARTAAEAALRANEAKFRAIANATPALVWACAADGRLVFANERWVQYTGQAVEQARGFGWAGAIHPDDLPPLLGQWHRCRATATPYEGEVRYRRHDGEYRWHAYRALPGDDGEALDADALWFGCSIDVHDAKVAVQRLRADEARTELALSTARAGTWDWDLRTHVGVVSDSFRDLLGFGPDDPVTVATWHGRLHPTDLERVRRYDAAFFAGEVGPGWQIEYRIHHPTRGLRWIAGAARLERDADGRPVRFIGVCLDTTELRQAEEAVRRSEALLQSVIDGSPTLVFVKDLAGRYFLGNRAWRELLGLGSEQVAGITDAELFEPDTARALREADERALRASEPIVVEEVAPIGGRTLTYLSTKFALRDPHGTPYAICGVAMDVSEMKRAESLLREADRRKDQFIATLSHELRNPLAPIRTAAQILAAPTLDAERQAWARQVVQRQVAHMGRLLDDLLDLARITQGKLALQRERVVLNAVVDAAVEAARPAIDARRHRLVVHLPAEPPVLDADPVRLAQVVSNLLTNAAKYTDVGGTIELVAGLEAEELVLAVRDDGIGIPAEALEAIFGMFSQLEDAHARTEGGLGIGLALVRGLVELHGGRVEAQSAGPGRGSRFVVRLPLAPDAPRRDALPASIAAPAPAGRRVLVADDNRDAADSLALLLQLSGHEVRVAHDGAAALALAQAFRPEVALLDIGMPQLDGYAVARALRAEPWGADVRLVALTGWAQDRDKERASAAGFDRHLTKPVDPAVVEQLLA